MPWFAVHTEEIVHGVYHVKADSPEDAERKLMQDPHEVGEQQLYEAFSMEVERVEPLDLF